MITKETAISALLDINPITMNMFQRYGLSTEQNVPIQSIVDDRMMDVDFFIDVLNCYSEIESFNKNKYSKYSVPVLLDYLIKSHSFYRNKKLLEIEETVCQLLVTNNDSFNLPQLFHLFFNGYKYELLSHFDLEEKELFPYAKALNALAKGRNCKLPIYSLEKFEKQHDESERKLKALRNKITMFKPHESDRSTFLVLLSQINSLEKDLHIHAQIEDLVLVPKLLDIEKQIGISKK